MAYPVEITGVERLTADVKRFVLERPEGYRFGPGQAALLSIDREGWRDTEGPFSFTSLTADPDLEFIIKEYPLDRFPDHKGLTQELHRLEPGAGLLLGEPWGAVRYKGPGVFIAGGAGVTPFVGILRDLETRDEVGGNRLLFSNDREAILEEELRQMLGDDLVLTFTGEERAGYPFGRIDGDFLAEHLEDRRVPFYLCGPPAMVSDITDLLRRRGAEADVIAF